MRTTSFLFFVTFSLSAMSASAASQDDASAAINSSDESFTSTDEGTRVETSNADVTANVTVETGEGDSVDSGALPDDDLDGADEASGVDEEFNPEMTDFRSIERPAPGSALQEDPLDREETNETLAVIGAEPPNDALPAEPVRPEKSLELTDILERFRPYGRGDMELSIGLGGSGMGGGFTLTAAALFAYYVMNRLAPGLELSYLAQWGEIKYPQSLTLFPFLKFVLIRSHRFAPYLLVGGGRTLSWGGGDGVIDEQTGDFDGVKPVGSWVMGMGGGFMIGIGARARIQLQLLALFRLYDETVLFDPAIIETFEYDANGNWVSHFSLEGEKVDKIWYPAPSFWFSFAL